jgi:alpha-tubulin suppressor-like RCC1 family protein
VRRYDVRCLALGLVLAVAELVGGCGRLSFDATLDGGDGDSGDAAEPTTGPWAQVFANAFYSCAVKDTGETWCWGQNGDQELGLGVVASFSSVGQLPGAWKSISLGRFSACGIQLDGSLWCWGQDSYGQIPDGMLGANRSAPVKIGGDTDWTHVEVAFFHGCARKQDSTLWCWGDNGVRQYDPSVPSSGIPRLARTNVRSFDADYQHTHAIDNDGSMWFSGEAGDGAGGIGVSYAVSAGFGRIGTQSDWAEVGTQLRRTCATKIDGSMYCFGDGRFGAIGNGAEGAQLSPALVVATGSWMGTPKIGFEHNCAQKSDGVLWCWGAVHRGQLGMQTSSATIPIDMGLVRSFAVGDHHTCIVSSTGVLRCSGSNHAGQIRQPPATALVPLSKTGVWAAIDSNDQSTCAIDAGGLLSCWGANTYGNLGVGDTEWRQIPTVLAGGAWSEIAVGPTMSLGIANGGELYWWGQNPAGGPMATQPTRVGAFTDFKRIAAGREHVCALRNAGDLYCWGINSRGQVGIGNATDQVTPQLVGSNFSDIAAGQQHTCAVQAGALRCWGFNMYGQIGDNSLLERQSPTPVSCAGCVGNVAQLALGNEYSLARMTDGTVFGWGFNGYGQLGNGTLTSSQVGVPVAGAALFEMISAGDSHACGVTVAGGVQCWGHGDEGQLGDGTTVSQAAVPVNVGSALDWISVDAGNHHACALKITGERYCWGANDAGQYGDDKSWVGQTVALTPDQ